MSFDPFANVPQGLGSIPLFPTREVKQRLLGDTPTLVDMGMVPDLDPFETEEEFDESD